MLRGPALLLWLAGSALLLGADGVSPDAVLLQRARAHMAGVLTSLPNYTCLQTIERSYRAGPKRKPTMLDVVRIEVALVDGNELFSWPGTGQFSDTPITDMVQGGAIGNGSFALHAKSVFQGNAVTFRYEGTEEVRGRKTHKWSFSVPQFRSGYTIRANGTQAVVAYSGAFWIEAATMDALRLEVRADDLPRQLKIQAATDMVEYQRVLIGSEMFLLPAVAELSMTDSTGNISTNRTRFSKCRQYGTESTLSFEEPTAEALETKSSSGPPREITAPPKLQFDIELVADVDLRSAAVGDPVTASLMKPLKLPDGTILPKGALAHGRLTLLRPGVVGRYSVLAIGVRFNALESGNLRMKMASSLVSIQTAEPAFVNRPGSGPVTARQRDNETILGSIFFVREYTPHLRRGLRMTWITTKPDNEDQQ